MPTCPLAAFWPGWPPDFAAFRALHRPATAFCSTSPAPARRSMLAKMLERGCGVITDIYLTVSHEQAADAMRLHFHPNNPQVISNGRDSRVFHPDAQARQKIPQHYSTGAGSAPVGEPARPAPEHGGSRAQTGALTCYEERMVIDRTVSLLTQANNPAG